MAARHTHELRLAARVAATLVAPQDLTIPKSKIWEARPSEMG
jgi:hypothetical protein